MSEVAVILAGGLGTRLRPYTITIPKPLVPVGDIPISEILIRQLKTHGFSRVIFAVNHQADFIRAYFGDGAKWGIQASYSLEETPLGTMGPLTLLKDLPEDFLVMNGDVLTDLSFSSLLDEHRKGGAHFTISGYSRRERSDYGVLELNSLGQLTGFYEKPLREQIVSMGVYALNRRCLDFIPKSKPFGFDQLMGKMIEAGDYPKVRIHPGVWLDIGLTGDYERANELFRADGNRFLSDVR